MQARHVIGVAAAAIALAGCSSPAASEPGQVTVNTPTAQAPQLPACKAVFVPGKVVDKAKASAGCTSPSGGVQFIGAFDCSDGTVLWQVDANTGAPAGYAREGKPYVVVKGDVAANGGYKKAYNACLGQPSAAGPARKGPVVELNDGTEVAAKAEQVVKTTPVTAVADLAPGRAAEPEEPAAPAAQETIIPVPGGEWAHAPATPTPPSTEDD